MDLGPPGEPGLGATGDPDSVGSSSAVSGASLLAVGPGPPGGLHRAGREVKGAVEPAGEFDSLVDARYSHSVQVFSDSSRDDSTGSVGVGFCVPSTGYRFGIRLACFTSILSAELYSIFCVLKYILRMRFPPQWCSPILCMHFTIYKMASFLPVHLLMSTRSSASCLSSGSRSARSASYGSRLTGGSLVMSRLIIWLGLPPDCPLL